MNQWINFSSFEICTSYSSIWMMKEIKGLLLLFVLFCLRGKKNWTRNWSVTPNDTIVKPLVSSNPDKIRLRRKICFKDPQAVLSIVKLDKENFCFTSRVRERKADKNVKATLFDELWVSCSDSKKERKSVYSNIFICVVIPPHTSLSRPIRLKQTFPNIQKSFMII